MFDARCQRLDEGCEFRRPTSSLLPQMIALRSPREQTGCTLNGPHRDFKNYFEFFLIFLDVQNLGGHRSN